MNGTVTLTGETALAVKYAVALARIKFAEFAKLSDDEILSRLIECGLDVNEEVEA